MLKEYIRKADIILLIALIAVGTAASVALAMHQNADASGARVVISSGGSLYASYPLTEDRVVTVPTPKQSKVDAPGGHYDYYNVITIEGGEVSVSEATCKNQICVRHAAISRPGESIVCLPGRLVVSIEGGGGGGYDSITS